MITLARNEWTKIVEYFSGYSVRTEGKSIQSIALTITVFVSLNAKPCNDNKKHVFAVKLSLTEHRFFRKSTRLNSRHWQSLIRFLLSASTIIQFFKLLNLIKRILISAICNERFYIFHKLWEQSEKIERLSNIEHPVLERSPHSI